ncbi:MAG: WXG100 family type VII secretion target [Bacilli bacterium]|nr:WXG100 family type VII secretion target [Bacilli bacterium]
MQINTSSISTISEQIKENISDMKKEHQNIKSYISDMKKGWKGENADKFYKTFEEIYLKNLIDSIDVLSDFQTFISKVPGAYETIDNSYASKNIEV